MATPQRPVMRYHGGKWILAPWIISHFPTHRVYVEPYCGAASVLMRKPRSYAEVLNDLDAEVVNVFQVLRDPEQAAELERLLTLTPYARDEFRKAWEPASDPVERARRRFVRAGMGFGSTVGSASSTGYRGNPWRSGDSNGMRDWARFPSAIDAFVERMQGVGIESRPALEVIGQQDSPETLFYVDPPYPHSTRSSIRWPSDLARGYAHEMSDEDHRALAAALNAASGKVVLSGYPCDLYAELYADWTTVDRVTLADGARKRRERLWLSPSVRLGQGSLFRA